MSGGRPSPSPLAGEGRGGGDGEDGVRPPSRSDRPEARTEQRGSDPDRPQVAGEQKFVLPSEIPLPPRVDLRIAAFFLLLGIAILTLSLRMPTYLDQQGAIYVAPGLVPGLYGIVIAGLAIWLGARALGRRRQSVGSSTGSKSGVDPTYGIEAGTVDGTSNVRLALAALLCLVFAVGLIGRLPFWLAAAVFVTLFIALFEWTPGLTAKERLRPLATAAVQGLVTGLLVTLVFEKVFYVRLP